MGDRWGCRLDWDFGFGCCGDGGLALGDGGLGLLSELEMEPFANCFRDEDQWRIDEVVAEMTGLDIKDRGVREMMAHYRLMFASEPNVNGRNRVVLGALSEL